MPRYLKIALAQVALRKESVDRNDFPGADLVGDAKSLSARRAWIEILMLGIAMLSIGRRSPQGERG